MNDTNTLLYGPDNRIITGEERAQTLEDVIYSFKAGLPVSGGNDVSEATAYQLHAWVHACVSAVARTVASTPFRLTRGNKKSGIIDSGPVYDLFRRPSPRKSRYELWYGTIALLELTGNALWYLEMPTPTSRKLPRAIRLLDSRLIKPIRDKATGELLGYSYRAYGNKPITLSLEEVIHFMYFNPSDPYWGVGPLGAAMSAVRTDVKVGKYNEDFFARGAQLGGVLVNKRGVTTEQLKQMREQFDAQHSGMGASHRTAILSGDWDYKQYTIGQREMEFMEQRKFVRETVGAVFGTPGIIINDPNNRNFATASAELRLWAENNWLPKTRYIEDVLDAQFFDRFVPQIQGFFDTSDPPGLRDDLLEKAKACQTFYKIGVPLNQLITALALPFEHVPWGNEAFLTLNDAPVSNLLTNAPHVAQQDVYPDQATDASSKTPPKEKGKDPTRVKYWRALTSMVTPMERKLERKISRHLFSLRKETISNIVKKYEHREPVVFSIEGANEGFISFARPATIEAFNVGFNMVLGEIGRACEPDSSLMDIRLDSFANLIKSLHDKLENKISSLLQMEAEKDDVLDAARSIFGVVSNCSDDIARTEVYSALNTGRIAAMSACGVTGHEWLSAPDEELHLIDSEYVTLGSEFSNGLRFPCDTGGSLSSSKHIFKCRCVTIPIP